jgi:hypothetical protein
MGSPKARFTKVAIREDIPVGLAEMDRRFLFFTNLAQHNFVRLANAERRHAGPLTPQVTRDGLAALADAIGYLFCSASLLDGMARQTIAVATTPPVRRSTASKGRRTVPPPEKFILNKPKPKANPIAIQIEAVATALGHSLLFIYSDNAKLTGRQQQPMRSPFRPA